VTIIDRSEALADLDRLARVYGRRAMTRRPSGRRQGRRARRSCIILGSGRSGTSMVAGTLGGLGYFMGDNLLAPREANPKGFFEDHEIIRINEALMARACPGAPCVKGTGWLVPVPLGTQFVVRDSLARRMALQTAKKPFCFKDPRFCYTLEAWRPYLGNALFVCVFREPARCANGIVKEGMGLSGVQLEFEQALRVWTLMHRHVLGHHLGGGQWVFVHYDQVLDGSAAARLEAALGTEIDMSFPDGALRRSPATGPVDAQAQELYRRLCCLADYLPETPSGPPSSRSSSTRR
jgi:hypothetical protein